MPSIYRPHEDAKIPEDTEKPSVYGSIGTGDLDFIKSVIDEGGDVNKRNDNGRTPFDEVCLTGDIEILKLLIAGGLDLESKCDKGFTPQGLLEEMSCGSERDKEIISQDCLGGHDTEIPPWDFFD